MFVINISNAISIGIVSIVTHAFNITFLFYFQIMNYSSLTKNRISYCISRPTRKHRARAMEDNRLRSQVHIRKCIDIKG